MKKFFNRLIFLITAISLFFSFSLHLYALDDIEMDNSSFSSLEIFIDENEEGAEVTLWNEKINVSTTDLENEASSHSLSYEINNYCFLVTIKASYKSSDKLLFYWTLNVDCTSHPINKPDINVTFSCLRNIEYGRDTDIFTAINILDNTGAIVNPTTPTSYTHKIRSKIDYATDLSFSTRRMTGHYRFSYKIDVVGEFVVAGGESLTDIELINRTCKKWIFTYTDNIGKTLEKPYASWAKNDISTNFNYRAFYFKEYTQRTGVTLKQDDFEIHHMRPRAYGGNHDYDNLIHLPPEIHKQITSWFNGYSE